MSRRAPSTLLREARQRIKRLEAELDEVKADRDRLRAYFAKQFNWVIDLIAEGKIIDLKWLARDMIQQANSLKRWWWP